MCLGISIMEIFVVVHATFTNENVFFQNAEAAQQYIDKRVAELGNLSDWRDWRIVKLKEGKRFEGEELGVATR